MLRTAPRSGRCVRGEHIHEHLSAPTPRDGSRCGHRASVALRRGWASRASVVGRGYTQALPVGLLNKFWASPSHKSGHDRRSKHHHPGRRVATPNRGPLIQNGRWPWPGLRTRAPRGDGTVTVRHVAWGTHNMDVITAWRIIPAALATVVGGWVAFWAAPGRPLEPSVLVVGIAAIWLWALWPRRRAP
jgi:hypothetical protein